MKTALKLIRVYLLRLYTTIFGKSLTLDENILIVAAHPDDEVLGCGGLIQQAIAQGKRVTVVILSDGSQSHAICCRMDPNLVIPQRRKLALDTWALLGDPAHATLHLLNYPDGQIKLESPETEKLKEMIEKTAPDAIYVPNLYERFPDHLEAQKIILSVVANPAVKVYEYCVWAWYFDSWSLLGKKGELCVMSKEQQALKSRMIDSYLTAIAPCGNPWSGILPKALVEACRWRKELFFRIR